MFVSFTLEKLFNSIPNVIILNVNFTEVNEISSTKTKHFILQSLLYNKKVYNLTMADIEAETRSC